MKYNVKHQIEIFCHQSVYNHCSPQYEASFFEIPFQIPWEPSYESRRDLPLRHCCAGNNLIG